MKILILNCGSSSIKSSIYDFSSLPDSLIEPAWNKEFASGGWTELQSHLGKEQIDCIGLRIVHGGNKYKQTILIDAEVKREIHALSNLAPLHNRADLEGIEILEKLFPGVPQFAVFDTAFHSTMPESAAIYPGPYEWVQMGIRRFGFHGISFQYVSRRAAEMLNKMPEKMVICHLGSGASLCALKNGKSIDTTMGFTPLEGLMMDTRSGSIDPGILLYLLEKKNKTPQQLSEELNAKSGLLGLSGLSSDMRDVLDRASAGHARSQLAIGVYLHRLNAWIGSMIASLGGIDTLVFTAGIGENASLIREAVCARYSFLGIELKEDGEPAADDRTLSSPNSKVHVLVIHTQEAFEMARECWKKQVK